MIKAHINFSRKNFNLIIDNIDVKSGSKTAVLGENGSGKSTLLHILCGFLNGGDVFLGGENLETTPHYKRAKIYSFLPQLPQLSFPFSVQDVVHFGTYAEACGKNEQALDERTIISLNQFGLFEMKDKSFEELSGGEKRRVMLARAVNQNTPLIYLDEPVSMLDVRHSLEIMEYVKNSDKTVIASMHDINLSLQYFDRFIFLKNGKLIGDTDAKGVNEKLLEKVYDVDVFRNGDGFSFQLKG